MMPFSAPFMLVEIFVFIAGCCLGSFFNVVIYRLPEKQSLLYPDSHCPKCNRSIAFYDNIPLLSYVILGGKCRNCKERISPQYPFVEGLTGLLAVLLFHKYGLHEQFLIELFFVSLLVIITFIDLGTFLIPDVLSLTGIFMGFILSFFTPRVSWLESLTGILLGGGLFYLLAIGYQVLRRKDGLGGGDIKLLAMIGAFLGWSGVVFTILVASVVGAVVGLIAMRRSKDGLTTMIPFGPFLSLGAVCYLFFGQSFYGWYFGELLGM